MRFTRGRLFAPPLPRTCTVWSEAWRSQEERLAELESALRAEGAPVMRGGDFDRVDLTVRGALASTGLRMAIEEHGAGRQLVRVRVLPRPSLPALIATLISVAFAIDAAVEAAPLAA